MTDSDAYLESISLSRQPTIPNKPPKPGFIQPYWCLYHPIPRVIDVNEIGRKCGIELPRQEQPHISTTSLTLFSTRTNKQRACIQANRKTSKTSIYNGSNCTYKYSHAPKILWLHATRHPLAHLQPPCQRQTRKEHGHSPRQLVPMQEHLQ